MSGKVDNISMELIHALQERDEYERCVSISHVCSQFNKNNPFNRSWPMAWQDTTYIKF